MSEEPDYDPVDCPVADCEFSDVPRSVAAHVSGTDDADHEWDRLPYDGARSFVMDAKLQQLDAMDAQVPGASSARSYDPDSGSSSAGSTTGSAGSADGTGSAGGSSAGADSGATAGETTASATTTDREPVELDTRFADDAIAVLSLLRRYDTRDVASLDPFRLANLYALVSDLASAASDARTQVRDVLLEEIQDDREVEAEFGEIKRYTRESQRLKDDEVVRDALERAGVDPTDAMSLDRDKVGEFVEAGRLTEDAVFDVERKALIRRVSVATERRDELLAELDPELRELLAQW